MRSVPLSVVAQGGAAASFMGHLSWCCPPCEHGTAGEREVVAVVEGRWEVAWQDRR